METTDTTEFIRFHKELMERVARHTFEEAGSHPLMAATLVYENKSIAPEMLFCAVGNDDVKQAFVEMLRRRAAENECILVSIASEAWFASYASNDADLRPSERMDRKAALLLTFEAADEDLSEVVIIEIERDENGARLGKRTSIPGTECAGRFQSILPREA